MSVNLPAFDVFVLWHTERQNGLTGLTILAVEENSESLLQGSCGSYKSAKITKVRIRDVARFYLHMHIRILPHALTSERLLIDNDSLVNINRLQPPISSYAKCRRTEVQKQMCDENAFWSRTNDSNKFSPMNFTKAYCIT
jgi:hypothetical protein